MFQYSYIVPGIPKLSFTLFLFIVYFLCLLLITNSYKLFMSYAVKKHVKNGSNNLYLSIRTVSQYRF